MKKMELKVLHEFQSVNKAVDIKHMGKCSVMLGYLETQELVRSTWSIVSFGKSVFLQYALVCICSQEI